MFDQRRRRWANIETALDEFLEFAGLWMFCRGTVVQGLLILSVPWGFGLINQGLAGVNFYI